jgi:hypothetical protein
VVFDGAGEGEVLVFDVTFPSETSIGDWMAY